VLTAVDRERGAGDEVRLVGHQEQHGVRAMSSGLPRRPTGMRLRMIFSSTSGGTARTISVST
jgi:hypothetical protein